MLWFPPKSAFAIIAPARYRRRMDFAAPPEARNGLLAGHVVVFGGGLIGASLALALGDRGLARRVTVVEPDAAARAALAGRGAADAVLAGADGAVAEADLVVLAAPVAALGPLAAAIGPDLAAGALLMDVGSVKAPVAAAVAPHVPPRAAYVPAHPIVGSERSGPAAASAALFAGHVCVLTPGDATAPAPVRRAAAFWRALGMDIEIMTPAAHDAALARTSHAPHLVAYALMAALDRRGAGLARYAAGALRDMTRVAASEAGLWRDILVANRDEVAAAAAEIAAEVLRLLDLVARGDGDLTEELARLAALRRACAELPGWAQR